MMLKRHVILSVTLAVLFVPQGATYGQDETVRTPSQNVQGGAVLQRSPGRMARRGILEYQQFSDRAFRLTPAQRAQIGFSALPAEMLGETEDEELDLLEQFVGDVVIAILDTISAGLQTMLALLELQDALTDLDDGDTGDGGDAEDGDGTGETGGTTPAADEGVVAFLTADQTELSVGEETTVHLFVEQRSPNAAEDNGINTVSVNIEVSAAGIVASQVPVNILAGWDQFIFGVDTGTADGDGGIEEVLAGIDLFAGDRTEGIGEEVEVFNFVVQAVSAGTVELVPTNFEGGGLFGVTDWESVTGDDADYGTVTIVVQGR